jgi:ProP effector
MTETTTLPEEPAGTNAEQPQPTKPPKPTKPRIDARPVLERLFELHPKLFGARFLPLKLGIFEDLMQRHPEAFRKEELKVALGVHARSTKYLDAVASGIQRHDLDGEPAGEVAPEHVHHAIMEVFRRRQARSPDEAKSWLHLRLVRAVEASQLDRAAYIERVGARDDAALAAVDEAYAELAGRQAKRVALQRAYEGSGKSIEEFAEMYGMKPAEVRKFLA